MTQERLLGLTKKEEINLILTIGAQKTGRKRELSPIEAGRLCSKALDAGTPKETIRKACELTSSTMIDRLINLEKKLDSTYHHLVRWGSTSDSFISSDVAKEIAVLQPSIQGKLVKATIASNLDRFHIQAIKQLIERTDDSLDDIIEKIKKRTTPPTKIVLMCSILDLSIRQELSLKSQKQRDKIGIQLEKSKELLDYSMKNKKKILKISLGEASVGIIFETKKLGAKFNKEVETIVNKWLADEIN